MEVEIKLYMFRIVHDFDLLDTYWFKVFNLSFFILMLFGGNKGSGGLLWIQFFMVLIANLRAIVDCISLN